MFQKDTDAAMRRVRPAQIAQYPLDLAFLGKRHGHLEMQSDDVAIEVRPGQ